MTRRAALSLRAPGRYRKRPFRVIGCLTLGHVSGARWREWRLRFEPSGDAREAWLAEAQGRFFLTVSHPWWFENLEALTPGATATRRLDVSERAEATVLAAEGDCPRERMPGRRYAYVDLSGRGGAFATLEAEALRPELFLGRELFLDELALAPAVESPVCAECPSCGAAVTIRAPRLSVCAACEACRASFDVDERGEITWIAGAKLPKLEPRWPLGSVAWFEDANVPFTLLSVFRRSSGETEWDETLWHNPERGIRWVTESGRELSYSVPIGLGETPSRVRRQCMRTKGEPVTLRAWCGEASWRPRVGERCTAWEFSSVTGAWLFERDEHELRAAALRPLSKVEMELAFTRAAAARRKPLRSNKRLATLAAMYSERRDRITASDVSGLDPTGVRP